MQTIMEIFRSIGRRFCTAELLARSSSRAPFVRSLFVIAAFVAMTGWIWMMFETVAFGISLFE